MGLLGPSKEEEDALRNAQNEQLQSNGSNIYPSSQSIASSSNLTTVTTTDYESALEQPLNSDVEDNGVAVVGGGGNNNTNTSAVGDKYHHADRSRASSVSTIKQQQQHHEPQITPQKASAPVAPSAPVAVNEGDDNTKVYSPRASQIDVDNQAEDPIPLEKTLSQQSIARSHRSFTDENSPYGPPTHPRKSSDIKRTQSEEYSDALQKTLSRHSLNKKSIINQDRDELENFENSDQKLIDPANLDWDSPNDHENPKNWSNWKKWAITMITAMICLEVSFGSSLYVCGVPDIMIKMKVSQELAISGLTFYLIGLAFGPALAAPISELFGRRIVYITSLPISMLFTMGVGLSTNIHTILVLRFFAGFFASPAMAVAGGTIADIWDFEMMGLAMAGFCLAPFMGPVLGPVIGGFVAEKKGWKWTMWVNLMFAGAILFPVLLCPETYKPVLLRRRAKKRGLNLHKPKISALDFLKTIVFITLMTPMKMLIVEPIVMVFSIYIAFVFAVLFGFFEAYPIIFRGSYNMTLGISGLAFLGVGVGLVFGTLFYVIIDRYKFFYKNQDGTRGPRDDENNLILEAPETRLIICKVGAIALPPSLFWLGWSAQEHVHWICPVASGVLFGFGLILIFFSLVLYFSMAYPPLSLASALAANNLFRYILASVFPLFTVQMYQKLGIDWASSLFAFIALAMVPVPWIFEKWGAQLRNKSYYGYAAMIRREKEENAKLESMQNDAENEFISNEDGNNVKGINNSSSESDEHNEKISNRV